ncbi:MAG: AAA family ATPase [Bacteroidetes bacterium]|nr:AAA family ATPase [Bacteroidota bacterium]
MQLIKASRKNAKIKMALQAPSGAGKTYSSLLIAFGLCNDWTKIAVIDTENHSSELYSHLGKYNVLHVEEPFTPERYIEAIQLCVNEGMDVVILDSITHEWMNILEAHSKMTGNSYTNWSKLTPRHNAFVNYILQSPIHIIGTIRSKQEYVLSEKNGKQVPEKVGLKGVTRDGMDYEFTLVFEIDIKNNAIATKDRTSIFKGQPEFVITSETGKKILEWCNDGEKEMNTEDVFERINDCKSLDELLQLYYQKPVDDSTILTAFSVKRAELEKLPNPTNLTDPLNVKPNGKHKAAQS